MPRASDTRGCARPRLRRSPRRRQSACRGPLVLGGLLQGPGAHVRASDPVPTCPRCRLPTLPSTRLTPRADLPAGPAPFSPLLSGPHASEPATVPNHPQAGRRAPWGVCRPSTCPVTLATESPGVKENHREPVPKQGAWTPAGTGRPVQLSGPVCFAEGSGRGVRREEGARREAAGTPPALAVRGSAPRLSTRRGHAIAGTDHPTPRQRSRRQSEHTGLGAANPEPNPHTPRCMTSFCRGRNRNPRCGKTKGGNNLPLSPVYR